MYIGGFKQNLYPRRTVLPSSSWLTPLDIPGLADWYDASDPSTLFQNSTLVTPATANNDPVGGWKDKSGNANNAVQATAGNIPLLKLAVLNGRPVIRFDGGDDFLVAVDAASLRITGDITTFVVVKPTTFAQYNAIFHKGLTGTGRPFDFFLDNTTGIPTWVRNATAVAATAAPTVNVFSLLGVGISGSTVTHFLNGVANGSGTAAATTDDGGTLQIGQRADGLTAINGDIAELLIYNRNLSAGERAGVNAYLNSKWAIY